MPSYHVTWNIDIDADTPEAAAREARRIQADPESTATVFSVSGRWPWMNWTVDTEAGTCEHI